MEWSTCFRALVPGTPALYGYWREYALPTPAMLRMALPEGALKPRGSAVGWLFFEKVRNTPRVAFRFDLANPETGRGFGEIRVPFVVR